MAQSILLSITATPLEGQSQDEADAELLKLFKHYPNEALAEALTREVYVNTGSWVHLDVTQHEDTVEAESTAIEEVRS